MKIGFFDSGIGGLSLVGYARTKLPDADFIFYADTDNVPYGTKTKEEITALSDKAASFLISKGAEAIVIACNTATSAAAPYLRNKYNISIIGIEPAVKPAVKIPGHKRILVIATPFTVREKKLHDLVDRVDIEHRVDMLPTPELVKFAEQGEFDSDRVKIYLEDCFKDLNKEDYCAVVCGCTHFIHFKKLFIDIFGPDITVLDGGKGTVNNLCRHLKQDGYQDTKGKTGKTTYYRSGREVTDKDTLEFYQMVIKHAAE